MMASDNSSKKGLSGVATAYLVLYNVILCAGWASVGVIGMKHYMSTKSFVGAYDAFEVPLKVFQTAALLEIFHAAIGIVSSNIVLTAFQVMSRLMLLWSVTHSVPQVQDEVSVTMFVVAWTTTEVIRYAFYTFGLLNRLPYILTWCRYTFFIILYPIGVCGELLTIYAALPIVKSNSLYSVTLPNKFNISFNYYYALIFFMVLYLPIFPRLYSHMIRQRKKVIGGITRSKQD
ncbi:very-long-chain (3R)-3-hydroxyacyl-CoA dehydratase 2-like [Anneissia japonica]|uniref:very-long-chain (3R)-3-hydroxyacyl-CoA dehydratase 2-like n=1 Tax=Anneissia japonica TaxID=1529436 RepID=UPI00142565D2|nr:very-long-chain (3R)-3-hydroxyacyl-CoA dehydratase 2-like [Anneissia japonica]